MSGMSDPTVEVKLNAMRGRVLAVFGGREGYLAWQAQAALRT